MTQKSETIFEANVKPSLDRHIIERRIQLYGFPLRVRLCACMRLSVATVFLLLRSEHGVFVVCQMFLGHHFWFQLFFSDCLIQSAKKSWEPHFGLDSFRHFGGYVLNSILGVSQSIPEIHARSEAYAQ